MGWSIKVGKILGIDIKIHLTFFLILIWGALNYGGSAGPLYGVTITLALFALVLLHELGHSVAALWYGIPVKDITLLPIGGVARLERMPDKPIQELVVALAGPAVNVILAVVLLPLVLLLAWPHSFAFSVRTLMQPSLLGMLAFLLFANVTLVIFNMLPAFPLDGGRVFRAGLGLFMDYGKATNIAVKVGRFLAIGLGLVAIFTGQIFTAIIAFFIFIAGGQEGQAVAIRHLLRNVQARQALSSNSVALSSQATIGQVASMMLNSAQPNFAVLDPYNGEFLGVATSTGVAEAMRRGEWHRHITEIMHHARHIPRVTLNAPLDEAQELLSGASNSVVAVYDGLHFRGLITANDIYRVFHFLSRSGRAAARWPA